MKTFKQFVSEDLASIMKAEAAAQERSRIAREKSRAAEEANKPIIAKKNAEHEAWLKSQPKKSPAEIQKIKDDANAEWEENHKKGWSNE